MSNLHIRSSIPQVFSKLRLSFSRLSLQGRFLLIMGTSTILISLLFFAMFDNFTKHLLARIGARFAIEQSLIDKVRSLKPMISEMALAGESAKNPVIRNWAQDEHNRVLHRQAMEALEHRFHSANYFVAIAKSGNFYYVDAAKPKNKQSIRYTLNSSTADDKWILDFLKSGEDRSVKVSSNHKLGVVKLWVMTSIREGDKVIGALGTGVNLYEFASNASTVHLPSLTNMFIDHSGYIQVYNDTTHFDFPAVPNLTEPVHQHLQILGSNDGKQWLHQAIHKLDMNHGEGTETEFVQVSGRYYLAGLIAIPEIGWYDLTLLDLAIILPQADFAKMVLVAILGALVLLLILAFSLHKLVLKPVATLSDAVSRIRQGDFSSKPWTESSGEVKELISQFQAMAGTIYSTQQWLEDEIAKRTHQLIDARNILEISLHHERDGRETQANLMALMAHEMRSPIAVIGNTTQMLNMLMKSDRPDLLPRIEKIMGSVRQLAMLMDNFLSEKWLDMDKQGLNRGTGDLNQFCADAQKQFAENYANPVRFEPWSGDARFCADWKLLQIALSNLLDNASKYSPRNEEILMKVLSCKPGVLCIEVSDHGAGIPLDLQPHIFEKFARGRHEANIQGSGLGLYLVNWIARFHGGYTEVISTEGQGSTFRLCLPVC